MEEESVDLLSTETVEGDDPSVSIALAPKKPLALPQFSGSMTPGSRIYRTGPIFRTVKLFKSSNWNLRQVFV